MTNEWMQDESLQNIDPYKLEFLQALVFESSNLRKEQLLPFLMAVARRGQEKKVIQRTKPQDRSEHTKFFLPS